MIPGRLRAAGVLLAWALALAAAVVVIVRASYSADLSAFLPKSPDARQRVLIEQLQSGAPSRLLFIAVGGGDAAARAEASRALARELRGDARFEQVQNGDREAFAAVGQWLFEHRYALSPGVTAERFTEAGLREALVEVLSQLGTPGGAALRELLPRDPSGETLRIGESLIPAQAPRSEHGVWVGRGTPGSAPRAVLLASVRAAGADLDALERAIGGVHAAFGRSGAAARGLTLQLSGAPVFAVQSRALIRDEAHWLGIVGTLAMAALLLAAFASPLALGAAVLPVASGVLAGVAAVALAFGHVHGMTLGFGATLVGESVDYAIYYLVQARGAAGAPGSGWRHWLATGWPTVRLGLWTSVCGFAALVFSGFPGLAQLGVFSIAGLIGAALTTRYVLPVLRPDGAAGSGLRQRLGQAAAAVLGALPRLRRAILALAAAALALILWRGDLWRADLAALNPLPPQLVKLDQRLRNDLGASDARTIVVVQGADAETTLARTEAVAARLETLVDQGAIAGFESVTRFVPSLATQAARRASLPAADAVPALVRAATAGTPVNETRLAPFAAELDTARRQPPITLDSVKGSAVAPLVDALLLRSADGGTFSALLPLAPGARGVDHGRLVAAVGSLPGAQVLDVKHELDELYRRYLREALWMALAGAAGVVALVAGALRSARRVVAVCQPLALAVLLTLAGLAGAGAALGILHLVGLLLVVAVGSNYALFFDSLQGRAPAAGAAAGASPAATPPAQAGTRAAPGASTDTSADPDTSADADVNVDPDQTTDPDTLASLVLANLTTVVSFGLLAFSAIPALSAIGTVVAPGALLALLLAAAFARPRPSRAHGDRP